MPPDYFPCNLYQLHNHFCIDICPQDLNPSLTQKLKKYVSRVDAYICRWLVFSIIDCFLPDIGRNVKIGYMAASSMNDSCVLGLKDEYSQLRLAEEIHKFCLAENDWDAFLKKSFRYFPIILSMCIDYPNFLSQEEIDTTFELLINAGETDEYVPLFEAHNMTGSGSDWDRFIISILKEEAPLLLDKIDFDSDGDTFFCYAKDKTSQMQLCELVHEVLQNSERAAYFLNKTSPF